MKKADGRRTEEGGRRKEEGEGGIASAYLALSLKTFIRGRDIERGREREGKRYRKMDTSLIYNNRSTYIFCLYRPVAAGHFRPSSSGGLGALPLGALPLGSFFFLRISDLKDVFSCVGRLKRVLFACSEKGV